MNKKILLFAIGVMLFTSSFSSNFNIPSSNSSQEITSESESVEKEEKNTLFSESNPLIQELVSGVKSVSPIYFVFLAIGLLAYAIFGITYTLIVLNWSESSLIYASSKDMHDANLSLKEVVAYSLKKVKSMIWINIVPSLILAISFGLFSMILLGSFLIKDIFPPMVYISGILTVIVAFAAIYLSVKIQAAILLSKRVCIVENVGGKNSFLTSWKLNQGNILKMFRLGVMNATLGFCLTILVLLLMIPIALLFYFGLKAQLTIKIVAIFLASIFSVIVLMLIYAVPVLHIAIKYLSWNYAYAFFKEQKILKEQK